MLGAVLAGQFELGPLEATPIVTTAERPYRVAGLVTDSTRLPLLTGELLLTQDAADTLGEPTQATALITTQAGAAPQVAAQAPTALYPYQPDLIRVSAPTDSASLRLDVESGLRTAMVAFTALAVLVAVAALMNSMLMAVTARRAEIGMRKAVGARSRHIATLIAAESTVIGVIGGLVGLVLAIAAILTITITQHWTPVFDLRLGPLAILAGLAVGTLAALRAARLRPADTLRQ